MPRNAFRLSRFLSRFFRPATINAVARRTRLGVQQLEDRTTPAITFAFNAGNLSVSSSFDDPILISKMSSPVGSTAAINGMDTGVPIGSITSIACNPNPGDAPGDNRIDLSNVNRNTFPALTSLSLSGGAGNDTFILDFTTAGQIADGGCTLDGGAGIDTLILNQGYSPANPTVSNLDTDYSGANSVYTITFGGSLAGFDQQITDLNHSVEMVHDHVLAATRSIAGGIHLPDQKGTLLSDNGNDADGMVRLTFPGAPVFVNEFLLPTTTIIMNGSDEADSLNFLPLDRDGNPVLEIKTFGGDDSVTVNADGSSDIAVDLGDGTGDSFTLTGAAPSVTVMSTGLSQATISTGKMPCMLSGVEIVTLACQMDDLAVFTGAHVDVGPDPDDASILRIADENIVLSAGIRPIETMSLNFLAIGPVDTSLTFSGFPRGFAPKSVIFNGGNGTDTLTVASTASTLRDGPEGTDINRITGDISISGMLLHGAAFFERIIYVDPTVNLTIHAAGDSVVDGGAVDGDGISRVADPDNPMAMLDFRNPSRSFLLSYDMDATHDHNLTFNGLDSGGSHPLTTALEGGDGYDACQIQVGASSPELASMTATLVELLVVIALPAAPPMDVDMGLPTGKRQHKPLTITKSLDIPSVNIETDAEQVVLNLPMSNLTIHAAGNVVVGDGDVTGDGIVRADTGDHSFVEFAIPTQSLDLDFPNAAENNQIDFLGVDVDPTPSSPFAILLTTGSGADTISFDFTKGVPIPAGGITIDGGDGEDTLLLNQGFSAANPDVSNIEYDSSGANAVYAVTFGGSLAGTNQITDLNHSVEKVQDHVLADTRTVHWPPPIDTKTQMLLTDNGDNADGMARLAIQDDPFFVNDFLLPKTTLTLDGSDADDSLVIAQLDFMAHPAININTFGGDDTVRFVHLLPFVEQEASVQVDLGDGTNDSFLLSGEAQNVQYLGSDGGVWIVDGMTCSVNSAEYEQIAMACANLTVSTDQNATIDAGLALHDGVSRITGTAIDPTDPNLLIDFTNPSNSFTFSYAQDGTHDHTAVWGGLDDGGCTPTTTIQGGDAKEIISVLMGLLLPAVQKLTILGGGGTDVVDVQSTAQLTDVRGSIEQVSTTRALQIGGVQLFQCGSDVEGIVLDLPMDQLTVHAAGDATLSGGTMPDDGVVQLAGNRGFLMWGETKSVTIDFTNANENNHFTYENVSAAEFLQCVPNLSVDTSSGNDTVEFKGKWYPPSEPYDPYTGIRVNTGEGDDTVIIDGTGADDADMPNLFLDGGAGTDAVTVMNDDIPIESLSFSVRQGQAPGTHWYHAHKHGSTSSVVASNTEQTSLPSLSAADLMLQVTGDVIVSAGDINGDGITRIADAHDPTSFLDFKNPTHSLQIDFDGNNLTFEGCDPAGAPESIALQDATPGGAGIDTLTLSPSSNFDAPTGLAIDLDSGAVDIGGMRIEGTGFFENIVTSFDTSTVTVHAAGNIDVASGDINGDCRDAMSAITVLGASGTFTLTFNGQTSGMPDLVIDGGDGDDMLTLDASVARRFPSTMIDLGGGTNSFILTGAATNVTYSAAVLPGAGDLWLVDGMPIMVTGAMTEQIDFPCANLTIFATGDGTIAASPVAGDGASSIKFDPTNGVFPEEELAFVNPSNSLTVSFARDVGADNTLTFNGLGSGGFLPATTIDLGEGNDAAIIAVLVGMLLPAVQKMTVIGGAGTDTFNLTSISTVRDGPEAGVVDLNTGAISIGSQTIQGAADFEQIVCALNTTDLTIHAAGNATIGAAPATPGSPAGFTRFADPDHPESFVDFKSPSGSLTFDFPNANEDNNVEYREGRPAINTVLIYPTSILIETGSGNDTVTLDFSMGSSATMISVDGGPPTTADSLVVIAPGLVVSQDATTIRVFDPAMGVDSISMITYSNFERTAGSDAVQVTGTDVLNPDQFYVQTLYLHFLGRTGSMGELNGWVAQKTTVDQADMIAHSREACTFRVNGYYMSYLGRATVGGEEQGWVNLLVSGETDDHVASAILGSSEFNARAQKMVASGTPDERFVTALYQTLLVRDPEAEGLSYWSSQTASQSHSDIAFDIRTQPECRSLAVANSYTTLLGRPGSPAEIAGWVDTGMDPLSIEIAFTNSDEYRGITGVVITVSGGPFTLSAGAKSKTYGDTVTFVGDESAASETS